MLGASAIKNFCGSAVSAKVKETKGKVIMMQEQATRVLAPVNMLRRIQLC